MRRRMALFGIVGVVNTAVYYGCYLGLRLVVPYLLAHVLATLIAMCGSYLLNCYVTFHTRPRWRTFVLFPLPNLANMVLTTVGMRIAVGTTGLDERIAPLPVALVAIPVTFVLTHYLFVGTPLRSRGLEDAQPEITETGEGQGRPRECSAARSRR